MRTAERRRPRRLARRRLAASPVTLWNPAQGFGVIDVAALLAAFE